MGKYRSTHTGQEIDTGVTKALNPDSVPSSGSSALITSDAVNKVQQGFAPIETASAAANNYAVDDLLVYNGVLYKAKTAIYVGDTLTVGTNIEATTVAEKLNNVDTQITANTDTTLTGLLKGNGDKVSAEPRFIPTVEVTTAQYEALVASGTVDPDVMYVITDDDSDVNNLATKSNLASIQATGNTNATGSTITNGTYFYLNGILVQAKTDIASGATFTNGTNYTVVTAGALNELKSAIDTKIDKSGAYFSFLNAQIVNDNDNRVLFSAESSVEMMAGASKNVVASTNGSFKCLSTTHGSYKPVDASAFNVQSSYLIKENIQNLTAEDAKKILSIRPVSFDYKKGFGESNQYGVIAEEAREIIPFAVTVPNEYDETRFDEAKGIDQPILSVDYSKFIPHLIRMIQIQQQEIEKLKAKIEAT